MAKSGGEDGRKKEFSKSLKDHKRDGQPSRKSNNDEGRDRESIIGIDDNTNTKEVFIGGLPFGTTQDTIEELLIRDDKSSVEAIKILPKGGACFVSFNNEESARKLLGLDGIDFKGRSIRCSYGKKVPERRERQPGRDRERDRVNLHPSDDRDRTIFMGNLDYYTKEEEIRDYFDHDEEIERVNVLKNKGAAFVRFRSRESAEKYLDRNGSSMGGRSIRMNLVINR